MQPEVHGRVSDGFDRVLDRFRQIVADGTSSADLCVHVGGEQVVDLRAGRREDDVQCVFSATKGAVAACANLLVDRGTLNLDAPVVRHWPEFGVHGKQRVTVRDVLEHRCAVLAPDSPLDWGELADWDTVCSALADATPAWTPDGDTYGYHAQSFGWLVGELVRRVDGRGLVDFLATEVAGPAHADILLGLPDVEVGRLLPVRPSVALPDPDEGGAGAVDPSQFTSEYTMTATTLGGSLPEDASLIPTIPQLRRLPIAASNGYSNARGLARMYAWLLTELSARTLRELTTCRTAGPDLVLSCPVFDIEQHFSRGFEVMEPLEGCTAFGHNGLGGTTAFADPEHHLALAFTTTTAIAGPPGLDGRVRALVAAVHECLA